MRMTKKTMVTRIRIMGIVNNNRVIKKLRKEADIISSRFRNRKDEGEFSSPSH
jgi:hypothetical protein